METGPESAETARLLSELDLAIDQLSKMREIVTRYERLHRLESVTGPSRRTRAMRHEIEIMESRLKFARTHHQSGMGLTAASG